MEHSISVIMLAGSIQPSPLRQAMGLPAAALPLSPGRSLLSHWLGAVNTLPGCREVRIVVNDPGDAARLEAAADCSSYTDHMLNGRQTADASNSPARSCRVMLESASWRGTAGLLRDIATAEFDDERSLIVVIETTMMPPRTLLPLIDAFDEVSVGVIGATPSNEPNGVCMFRREVIEQVPPIGYFDLKEQLLPLLHRRGRRVRAARFEEDVLRIHDRPRYLCAVECMACRNADATGETPGRDANRAAFPGARIEGVCLIEDDVRIDPGAIVHDSVLLAGARVGAGAVVSRSVVGPGAEIPPESRVVRELIQPGSGSRSKPELETRFASRQEEGARA